MFELSGDGELAMQPALQGWANSPRPHSSEGQAPGIKTYKAPPKHESPKSLPTYAVAHQTSQKSHETLSAHVAVGPSFWEIRSSAWAVQHFVPRSNSVVVEMPSGPQRKCNLFPGVPIPAGSCTRPYRKYGMLGIIVAGRL